MAPQSCDPAVAGAGRMRPCQRSRCGAPWRPRRRHRSRQLVNGAPHCREWAGLSNRWFRLLDSRRDDLLPNEELCSINVLFAEPRERRLSPRPPPYGPVNDDASIAEIAAREGVSDAGRRVPAKGELQATKGVEHARFGEQGGRIRRSNLGAQPSGAIVLLERAPTPAGCADVRKRAGKALTCRARLQLGLSP